LFKVGFEAHFSAKDAGCDFGNQFFKGIVFLGGKLAETVKAAFVACGVGVMPMSA
jgi:hypothetical protein